MPHAPAPEAEKVTVSPATGAGAKLFTVATNDWVSVPLAAIVWLAGVTATVFAPVWVIVVVPASPPLASVAVIVQVSATKDAV